MAVSQNGWPVNPPRSRRRIMSPRSNVEITVINGPGGDLLLWVLGQIDQRVEDVDLDSTRGEMDDWGHNDRPIRGGVIKSNHASATGADFNATRHPLGVPIVRTFTAAQIAEIRKICRETGGLVVWGGDWKRPDGMHVELRSGSTEGECRKVLDRLLAHRPPTGGVLREGDSGKAVSDLQARLNRMFPAYSKLAVDGDFGPATTAVVKEVQRRSGLRQDGEVGPITRRVIGG